MADLHYKSMPHDLSTELVSALHISEFESNSYCDKSYYSDSNSFSGLLLSNGINVCEKSIKDHKEQKEKCKTYRKYELISTSISSCYDNYGSVVCKSNSLPGRYNFSSPVPNATFATDIQAEDLASQLTLLDINVLKCIKPEELSSCSWNKKNKLEVAPNVVSFTRRFNHASFWTVQEILNAPTPKQRSEILVHFIRVAKKLYDLNNLHSLFAIVSGLQSASIYRLNKTWAYLSKKDRCTFDKLAEVFSDKRNWINLRDHMDSIKLPCVPYLGLFLTDLVYIDMVHPPSKIGDNHQRILKMNAVLSRLTIFQTSEYPSILPLPNVQRYLSSVRYIEELQKFLEDDHFKLSMKLEPNSPIPSSSSSKESVGDVISGVAALSLSPARGCAGSLRLHAASAANKFVPGHRKCRSLGTKFRSTSLPRNFHKQGAKYGFNLTIPGIFGRVASREFSQIKVRHLLDDSVLEEPNLTTQIIDIDKKSPRLLADVINENSNLVLKISAMSDLPCNINGSVKPHCIIQGSLRRKVILRDGRKPTVSTWQKYWVQLWPSYIVYFSSKCFKGNDRGNFKSEPYKMVCIMGWIPGTLDSTFHTDTFLLADPKKGNVYKFRATSTETATQWIKELQVIVNGAKDQNPIPTNLMSFE